MPRRNALRAIARVRWATSFLLQQICGFTAGSEWILGYADEEEQILLFVRQASANPSVRDRSPKELCRMPRKKRGKKRGEIAVLKNGRGPGVEQGNEPVGPTKIQTRSDSEEKYALISNKQGGFDI
jgi:hypothetical protein